MLDNIFREDTYAVIYLKHSNACNYTQIYANTLKHSERYCMQTSKCVTKYFILKGCMVQAEQIAELFKWTNELMIGMLYSFMDIFQIKY